MAKDEYLVRTPHDGDWFYALAELEAGLTSRQLDPAWPIRKDSDTNWTTIGALFPQIIAEQKSYNPPKDAHCYLLRNGKQEGPFVPEQIRNMWAAGQITVDALYWFDGLDNWFPVKNVCDPPPRAIQHSTPTGKFSCPHCHSQETTCNRDINCAILIIIFVSLGLGLVMIPFLPYSCACRACGNKWKS